MWCRRGVSMFYLSQDTMLHQIVFDCCCGGFHSCCNFIIVLMISNHCGGCLRMWCVVAGLTRLCTWANPKKNRCYGNWSFVGLEGSCIWVCTPRTLNCREGTSTRVACRTRSESCSVVKWGSRSQRQFWHLFNLWRRLPARSLHLQNSCWLFLPSKTYTITCQLFGP